MQRTHLVVVRADVDVGAQLEQDAASGDGLGLVLQAGRVMNGSDSGLGGDLIEIELVDGDEATEVAGERGWRRFRRFWVGF